MLVSVIVCTRNRAGALADCVRAVEEAIRSSTVRSEFIVVDNGSTDDTLLVLRELQAQSLSPMRILYEPRAGLSVARNAGIQAARGDVFVLTDDDCRLNGDYLERLAGLYDASSPAMVIGGSVHLGDADDWPLTIITRDSPEKLSAFPDNFLAGCNMTFNRLAYEAVGAFDESLGAGSRVQAAEDTDWIYRAWCLNITVLYEPQLRVWHFHGRRSHEAARRLHLGYSRGTGALIAKYLGAEPSKHLLWSVRNVVISPLRRAGNIGPIGLSPWEVLGSNLAGMCLYWSSTIARACQNRRESQDRSSLVQNRT